MKVSQFFLYLTLLFILFIFFGYLITHFLLLQRSFAAIAIAAGIAYFPTLIAYTLTYLGLDKETNRFIGFLITGMLLKMLVGVIFIVIVALQFPEVKGEYVVTYLVCYFSFTGFEVYALMRKLRPNF